MRGDVAVLFDLDGDVVDSRPHHLSAWRQLAREAALAHAPDYFTRTFGLRNEPIIRGLSPDIDSGRLRALAERKEQLFRGAARGNLELLPGVRELLAFLDEQDVAKAIVTSAPRANLDMAVETLGIGGHFQALVAEEDAAKGRPDPEGFLPPQAAPASNPPAASSSKMRRRGCRRRRAAACARSASRPRTRRPTSATPASSSIRLARRSCGGSYSGSCPQQ